MPAPVDDQNAKLLIYGPDNCNLSECPGENHKNVDVLIVYTPVKSQQIDLPQPQGNI